MGKRAELKDFKIVFKQEAAPDAVQAYTATNSSARVNVTLSLPAGPGTNPSVAAGAAVTPKSA
jgi:hypothetical protein